MLDQRTPTYRRQRRPGKKSLGFVEINGTRRYLGTYGTPESRQRYDALIAEWKSGGGLPLSAARDLRVIELVDRYWTHTQAYYRKPDGTPTSEQDLIKRALAVLVGLYGDLPAKDFSPVKFKAVRTKMIEKGWCRKVVNGMVDRVKRMIRWAVENELVPPDVHHGLQAVSGLRRGRCEARESEPVKPVPSHLLDATLPHLSPQVAAIVQLQLLTGARPGEVCQLRACDLDMSGTVWIYRPGSHKTEHHGHERIIYLGPKAQEVIRPFLKLDTQAYLFSPAEAEAHRRERQHAARKTPMSCGNRPGTNRTKKPKRPPGNRYDRTSYRRAISRACDVAFPPPESLGKREGEAGPAPLTPEQAAELKRWRKLHRWHPHQLRHNAATQLRAEFGIDVAQTILGHRIGSAVTEIYAAANVQKAMDVIQKIG